MKYLGAKPASETGIQFCWWMSDNPGSDMIKVARKIAEKQAWIREQMLWHARVHGGTEIAGLSPTAYSRPAVSVQVGETVGLNIVESCVSTAQAEICQNKPKATFATDGGDWETQQNAEKLDKFCEGQFYEVELYDKCPDIFADAAIFGTGIAKIFEDEAEEKIAVERVFPWEILVDQADALYGTPRCIYQTKYVDRAVLMAAYPKKKAELGGKVLNNPLGLGRDPFMNDSTADLVQVVEGWRLPAGKVKPNDVDENGDEIQRRVAKERKGLHIVAVDGVTLFEEEWTRPDLPFCFLRWLKRPFGFWGKGLTEQLAGIQKEINRLLIKIQRAFARLGITRVFIQRGSKVNPAHMRASDGDIIEYVGERPQTVAENPVSPQIFDHLWRLEQKAYEITGISQMTAQGQAPPPGVDSGRAIRTLLANHSKRFNQIARQYEEFFINIGKKMIALAHDIARREDATDETDEETGSAKTKPRGYTVRWATEAGNEEINLAEIDLDLSKYVMRAYPTSALPSNPGEKMQVVQEWFNTGIIDGDKAMMLMDFPDTKAFADMNPAIALYRAVMRKLNGIVKHGKEWIPDSFIDPSRAKVLAVPFLLKAEEDGVPPARLDMLRRTITDLVQLEQPPANQNGPSAAGQQTMGAGPQLDQPDPGALPGQVKPMGQMANPIAA